MINFILFYLFIYDHEYYYTLIFKILYLLSIVSGLFNVGLLRIKKNREKIGKNIEKINENGEKIEKFKDIFFFV